MSLINDALKKARAEAARRAAEEQGIPYPSVPHHRVRRRGGSWLPVALGAGAALAAVALAGLVWWGVSKAGPAGEAPTARGVQAGAPTGEPPASPPGSETTMSDRAPTIRPSAGTDDTATTDPATTAPTPRTLVSGPQAVPPERASDTDEPATTPATAPEPTAAPAESSDTAARTPTTPTPTDDQAPTASAPAAEPTPAATFRGGLPLPDGGRLELSGIAWSASPVAVLNGRVVGQGEVVEGHAVTAIERRAVVLRAPDGAAVRIELD